MLTATIYTLLGFQVVVSFLIIITVLMQRPKSEGLGAAFGGGMTENLFGAQTTSVLATFTRWLGGTFLLLTLTLSVLYAKQSTTRSAIQQQLMNSPKAAVASSPGLAKPSAPPLAAPAPSAARSPARVPSAAPSAAGR